MNQRDKLWPEWKQLAEPEEYIKWLEEQLYDPQITEMYLCETERLILHPNQLYKFIVDKNCSRCKALEKMGAAIIFCKE